MSTVRGNAPLQVTFTPKVGVNTYDQLIRIDTGGWCGQKQFQVFARLEVSCAKNLIRELRRGLRQIRDETRERLDKVVSDAEGPL